jgi:VIT1/CCC1 family predicted Fe2+/Mn2+ transporter
MHARDPLEAHLRDELGQTPHSKARPLQAALASAASFSLGGLIPFLGVFAPTPGAIALSIVGFALVGLLFTGITSAKIAGKPVLGPTVRVLIGGSLGMAVTAGVGRLFHITLG